MGQVVVALCLATYKKCEQVSVRMVNSGSIPLRTTMKLIMKKVSGLWIIQCDNTQQILFSHKNIMKCYSILRGIKLN